MFGFGMYLSIYSSPTLAHTKFVEITIKTLLFTVPNRTSLTKRNVKFVEMCVKTVQ